MDDFFGQKMMIFLKKVKIRLRNQNLKKKISPAAPIEETSGFYKIKVLV